MEFMLKVAPVYRNTLAETPARANIVMIPERVFTVADLPLLLENAPLVDAKLGVLLSGRAPIWVYAALAHHYHPTAWVAVFDPRLEGAVVVQSHCVEFKVGDVVRT